MIRAQELRVKLLAGVCLLIFVTMADAVTVNEAVERIQKEYSGIYDLSGKFSQTSLIKDLKRTEKYEGSFFIKKPSRMRWRYEKPRDEEVIIKETDLWIYRKSDRQVVRSTFSRQTHGQVPIVLLEGFGDMRANFDITMMDEGTLKLKPKYQMGLIKEILLEINPTGFPVKGFTILDMYGNRIVIKLREVKTNTGLEDSLFIFNIPPGVEVINLNP
jgi:outer membrane lipoprotein carrier protein